MSTIRLTFTYTTSDFISALRSLPLRTSRLWLFPLIGLVFLGAGIGLGDWFSAIAGCIIISLVVIYPVLRGVQMSRCPT